MECDLPDPGHSRPRRTRSGSALLRSTQTTMQGPREVCWFAIPAVNICAAIEISNFAMSRLPNLGHEMQRSPATPSKCEFTTAPWSIKSRARGQGIHTLTRDAEESNISYRVRTFTSEPGNPAIAVRRQHGHIVTQRVIDSSRTRLGN